MPVFPLCVCIFLVVVSIIAEEARLLLPHLALQQELLLPLLDETIHMAHQKWPGIGDQKRSCHSVSLLAISALHNDFSVVAVVDSSAR